MKAVLVNYNYEPTWLKEYPLETTIYDRSDDGVERDLTKYGAVIKTPNTGNVDYDKLTWLIENYDDLPEAFLWGKTNIFKYVDEPQLQQALVKRSFKPLLKQDHKEYSDGFGVVAYYQGEMYMERADSWFFAQGANLDNAGRFHSWQDWCRAFMLPQERYIPFPPGGNFILTSERVHRVSKDYYKRMAATLPYAKNPVEAHCCERSYFYLWR